VTDVSRSDATILRIGDVMHGTTHRRQKGGQRPPFCLICGSAEKTALAVAAVADYLGGTQVHPVTQRSEPMFNVPPAVVATVAVLVAVHVLRTLVLPEAARESFLLTFAFIPARYGVDLAAGGSFPGGFGADLWTFFTYAFLHADLLHIGLNVAWLVPFGSALERRFGAWRYAAFMLVVAAAGAFTHLATHPGAEVPMIGASAAISGAMAAALRFVFQQGAPLGLWRADGNDSAYRMPASSLRATLRNPRFLIFLATWIGVNALFGLGSLPIGAGEGQEVAWQAHIGGFIAGLLLFNAFDPVAPQRPGFDPRSSR
jgi:membrane associated rhomboid family serine protease